jgi:hypothetical protein
MTFLHRGELEVERILQLHRIFRGQHHVHAELGGDTPRHAEEDERPFVRVVEVQRG